MESRLSRVCGGVIEAGWLAALIVTPLFFNTLSNRVFEPDKIHLLRSIALVMAVAWLTQLLDTGLGTARGEGLWRMLRRTPLILPTLLLVIAYLLSTALSVAPRISFFGSYVRMQGTFTFLSYVAIFAMVLTHLRTRAQVNRLIYTVVLTSLPVSLYGLVQKIGADPLPWAGDVRTRVASNMGNAIFVAAYLIMAVFLTLERLLDSLASLLSTEKGTLADAWRTGCYLFILIVQLMAIVFTQSRGPIIGLGAGLYVFAMLGVRLLGRWASTRAGAVGRLGRAVRPLWFGLIGLSLAGLAFLVLLNLPQGPLASLRDKPYIGRMATVLDTTEGTNAVRVLIWQGVVDMMLKPHPPIAYPDGTPDRLNPIRPLIGYGPESMWVAYNRFYPPELAHYEARNASPDRSHNETFDALVRTGLLGFAAQLFLFGSVFYYALRWLGLIRGRQRRNLFLGLLGGGAALGVIVPWAVEGSLRLAGVGLPVGLIAGVILYVTIDLLLTREETDHEVVAGRQSLLILALLAAIVAHFVEVHFGIAIVSTLTHFWTFSALLVVVGIGWLARDEHLAPAAPSPATGPSPLARIQPAGTSRRKRHRRQPERATEPLRPALPALPAAGGRFLRAILPYAAIGALITLTLTWDYLVNQTAAQTAWAILWNAVTVRLDSEAYQVARSPILVLFLFTWLVGGLLGLAESARQQPAGRALRWGLGAALYAGAVVVTFLGYGLLQASRLAMRGLSGMDILHHTVGHVVVFDAVLLLLMLLLAAALWLADPRPRPARIFHALPAVPLLGGLLGTIIAFLLIFNINIRTVQADMYYKQGLAYEGAGAWESAAVLYLRAAQLEPQEDYYYLFLGRALLQFANTMPAGTPTLPADLEGYPTADLLPLIERGVRTRNREDLLRTAHAALVAAQRLNPLNTDHAANLARLSRTWAFVNALDPGAAATNAQLYETVKSRPGDVDMARLQKALDYYQQAVSLSPHNAQLWNELATTQFIAGQSQAALETLAHSLEIDSAYYQTYLYQGDLLSILGDREGALAAYRQAVALLPHDAGVQSAVGVLSAQLGHYEEALVAFRQVISDETTALANAQAQLAELDALAARAGGYSRLLPAATNRRDALQRAINDHQAQLHLTYRNLAIVLRDAGRLDEAVEAAQAALSLAGDADRPVDEALIADLQRRLSP